LQGLKPGVDLIGFIGPAEAVPLLQSFEESALQGVFQQPVVLDVDLIGIFGTTEVMPRYKALGIRLFNEFFAQAVKPCSLLCAGDESWAYRTRRFLTGL